MSFVLNVCVYWCVTENLTWTSAIVYIVSVNWVHLVRCP